MNLNLATPTTFLYSHWLNQNNNEKQDKIIISNYN